LIYLIVAVILLFFLSLIASLLLVSFHISLRLFKKGSLTHGIFRLRWLGITFLQRKIPQKEMKTEKRGERFDWTRMPEMGSLFIESYPSFANMLTAFTNSISIKRLSFDVAIGLGSPADTAMVSGYLWSLASVVNVYPLIYLSVEPDFQEERLDGSVMIELKVRLLRIALAFIKAFTKKPVRRLFSRMRG
jgi:hypothetical protein